MNQISKMADQKLNQLSRRIRNNKKAAEAASLDESAAWEEVFETFEEFDTSGGKFIAENGYTLNRQERQGSVKRNDSQLAQRLRSKAPTPQAFNAVWNAITVRVVDSTLLEKAVQQGKVSMEDVEACLEIGANTYARVQREWTKDDRQKAQIFGITLIPDRDEPTPQPEE